MLTRNSGATSRLRRVLAASVTALMAMSAVVDLAAPAAAADATAATVTKSLVNAQSEYLVGQTVGYRITTQCSSLTGPCQVGTLLDQLDPNLELQQVVYPTAVAGGGTLPTLSHTIDANNLLTITIGDAAKPYLDGQALEFVVYAKVKTYPSATNGIIPNQASISIPNGPTNVSTIVEVPVVVPVNDWSVNKNAYQPATNPVPAGSTVVYKLQWTRPAVNGQAVGGVDIESGTITDTLPPGSIYVPERSTPGGVYNAAAHTVTWPLPYISATQGLTCQGSTCYARSTSDVLVGVRYPSPTFTGDSTAINVVNALPNYVGGTTGDLDASATTTFVRPENETPAATTVKSGPATILPGAEIGWNFATRNTGNTVLANPSIIESMPAGLTDVRLVRLYVGSQPSSDPALPVFAEFSADGVTWGAPVQITAATTNAPAGTRFIRISASEMAVGGQMGMYLTARVAADAAVGSTLENCITSAADGNPTWSPETACVTTTVAAESATMSIRKSHWFNDPRAASVKPGELFHWTVAVNVAGGAAVDSITVADVLPKEFEYVDTDCFTKYYNGWYDSQIRCDKTLPGGSTSYPESLAFPDPIVEVQADGTTRVTYNDLPISPYNARPLSDTWHYIHLLVRVKPGTSIDTYTNTAFTNTNDASIVQCTNPNVAGVTNGPDVGDIDGDGDVTEIACAATDPVRVAESAYIDLTKWDMGTEPNVLEATGQPDATCPDWDGFTRYPCVAQTLPGGDFSYRLRMLNQGNIPLTDYVIYDILPIVGDTGVGETLSEGSRATEWSPVLTGPVTLDTSLSNATGSGYRVEYNLTSNPCRPELAEGLADADWQNGVCDDTWVTSVSDWSTVKSFRITAFENGAQWVAGEQMVFTVPMTAPLDAPQSTQEPLDLSVAWNSVAQRVFRTNADGSTLRLEAYEPRKVGIIVPFTLPDMVSVGDYVWFDENRDGQQDAAEAPAPGVVVRLLNAEGNPIAETVTDAEGYYWFTNLTPEADYTIVFEKPAGYEWTLRDTGADTSDSDVDPATNSIPITAPAFIEGVSQNLGAKLVSDDPTFDAGLVTPIVIPDAYAVGDYVWFDENEDGVQDADELVVEDVTVTLQNADGTPALDADGEPVASTTTDANGHYVFDNLPAGRYQVVFADLPVDFVTTVQNTAGDQSAADDSNVAPGLPLTATTPVFELGADLPGMTPVEASDGTTIAVAINRTIDAGIHAKPLVHVPSYAVGDYVWFDRDRDGVQDATEQPVVGATVTLQNADGTPAFDATGAAVASTTTDAAGHYVFDNLPAGEYRVVFADLPAGYVTTTQNNDGDQVSTDDSNVPADAAGTATTPSFVLGEDADGMSPVEDTDGVVVAELINRTIDAGLVTVVYAVGDYVWIDADRDGVQDAAEAPVPGVVVSLLTADGEAAVDADGEPVAPAITDAAGHYSFDNLPAGSYIVRFSKLPEGFVTTAQNTAGQQSEASDSNTPAALAGTADTPVFALGATEVGMSPVEAGDGVTLAATINRTIDAGLVPVVFAVGDYVWIDADKDGIQDAAEEPVSGVTVTLFTADGTPAVHADGSPVTPTTTDANGHYVFDNLAAGSYRVVFTQLPDGYETTTAPTRLDPAVADDSNVEQGRQGTASTGVFALGVDEPGMSDVVASDAVTLATLINRTIDAGLVAVPVEPAPVYSVGDYVWIDVDRDGIQDREDTGVSGVTVTLVNANGTPALDAAGQPVAPTVTTSAGHYSFDNLPAGEYRVVFSDLPGNSVTTRQNNAGNQTSVNDSNTPAGASGSATTPAFLLGPDEPGMAAVNPADAVTLAKTINRTIDAGLVRVVYAVGDFVWFDADRDGVQDAAEVPVSGVTVTLQNADGTPALDDLGRPVAAVATDSNGHYSFDNLPAGEYRVEFSNLPREYATTAQLGAGDPTTADDSNVPAGAVGTAISPSFTVGAEAPGMAPVVPRDRVTFASTINRTIDAGLVKRVFAVGDYVWIDADRDGVQDASEKPVPNVTVTLFTADGAPAVHADGTPVVPVQTDENGHYVFDNLAAGSYRVVFTKLPAGYVTTRAQTPLDQAAGSDSNVAAFQVGTASTGVFTLGLDELGMSEVLESDGVTIAMLINRTIDAGITLAPPLPETGTPPALAHTGQTGNGVIGGAALLLVIGGLVLMIMRRRQES